LSNCMCQYSAKNWWSLLFYKTTWYRNRNV
jgi:hypothetical protein